MISEYLNELKVKKKAQFNIMDVMRSKKHRISCVAPAITGFVQHIKALIQAIFLLFAEIIFCIKTHILIGGHVF